MQAVLVITAIAALSILFCSHIECSLFKARPAYRIFKRRQAVDKASPAEKSTTWCAW